MHISLTPQPPAQACRWLAPTILLIAVVSGCAVAPRSAPPVPPSVAPPMGVAPVSPDAAPAPASAPVPTSAPAPASSASTAEVPDPGAAFARWVDAFRVQARARGIDEATLHSAFDNVRLLPRVVDADRAQPEFTRTVWDYLDSAVSAQRIARGQEQLQQFRPAIDAAAARYGVPAEVLVAIWGMESNFGHYTGDIPTIDALATLGFEGRREDWARSQLLAALKILQNGDIARTQMLGSWAGAMGQTQFLPSNFLAYAVDADGDGRRDIWGSVPDVMASTAHFLAREGWQAGQPWGTEVRLPQGFDYTQADADVRKPTSEWAALGVQTVDGAPLPALEGSAVLLPAGARGPAFVVGPNFRAILRYNNATSYALGVGLLAQRLAGGPGVQTPWPRDERGLTRSQIQALQAALNGRGFNTGTPDGVMGPATRNGVRQYQRSLGLAADGYPTLELLQGLQ